MKSFIATQLRCSLVLLLSALLVSGCSSSSDANSVGTNNGATGIEDISLNDSSSTDIGEPTGGLSDSTSADSDEPAGGLSDSAITDSDESTGDIDESSTATDSSPTVAAAPDALAPLVTRIDFDITVPVYVSDSLQVQVSLGDRELSAGWVVDETWSVSDEFPSDTENLLNVTFFDDNGTVVLGSYEANYRTGTSPTETVEIFADQFDIGRWDDDDDGVSNLEESIAGTDPLAAPIPPTLNLVRVDFGINVPAIMSDELQVRVDWGDEEIFASWVGDESWSAFADLPADTREPLTVTFFDENGDLPLGSYITSYQTGNSDGGNVQIDSRRFNTHRFDADVDGVSNYREVVADTDPVVSDSSVPINLDSISEEMSRSGCSSCHSQWSDRDTLYNVLVRERSRTYAIPFEPDESRLVEKLEGSMLRYGGPELAELVRAWITLGALDN